MIHYIFPDNVIGFSILLSVQSCIHPKHWAYTSINTAKKAWKELVTKTFHKILVEIDSEESSFFVNTRLEFTQLYAGMILINDWLNSARYSTNGTARSSCHIRYDRKIYWWQYNIILHSFGDTNGERHACHVRQQINIYIMMTSLPVCLSFLIG